MMRCLRGFRRFGLIAFIDNEKRGSEWSVCGFFAVGHFAVKKMLVSVRFGYVKLSQIGLG